MKSIGLILLLYGVAGVVGTVITFRTLRNPVETLRGLLTALSEKLRLGGNLTTQASASVLKGIPILDQVAQTLRQIVGFLHEVAKSTGDAAGFIKGVETTMDAVTISVPSFQTRTLDLRFNVPIPSGIDLKEHKVDLLPGLPGGEVTLYGPPIKINTTNFSIDLGHVPVISGVTMTPLHPLEPAGDIFRNIGNTVDQAHPRIDQTGDFIDREIVQKRIPEAQETVKDTAERLKDFAGKLSEASQDVHEISQNKLLALIPPLLLGYFGLMHLALALTGLALLIP